MDRKYEGRTKKASRNITSGIGSKILVFVFAFVVRTAFVRILGAEYNGINGLFSNLLSVICLADLGVEHALSFSLYKELKDNNQKNIQKIVASFRKIYLAFAAFIMVAGSIALAMMRFLVNTSIPMGEVYGYFLLYLANSVASYLFVYKTTVLSADQNIYIYNIVFTITRIVQYCTQFAVLILLKSMWAYLIIQIICTILQNLILNYITCKRYSYLKKFKIYGDSSISKGILSNVKDTLVYRVASVAINNTDNIIISSLIGTYYAGLYSNYYMLVQYVEGIIYVAGNGLVASIGNLNAENDNNKSYIYFRSINLLFAIIGNVYVCCFMGCIQQFIPIWIEEEYLLPNMFAFSIVLQFYLKIIMRPVSIFRETRGLFSRVQHSMIIAAIINIILSVILGRLIGLTGVVLASIISIVSTSLWFEPLVLFKDFKVSTKKYYITQSKYLLDLMVSLTISSLICRACDTNLIAILLRGMLSFVVSITVCILFNWRTAELELLINKLRGIMNK